MLWILARIDNDCFAPEVDRQNTAVFEIDTVIHCVNIQLRGAHTVPAVLIKAR